MSDELSPLQLAEAVARCTKSAEKFNQSLVEFKAMLGTSTEAMERLRSLTLSQDRA